MILVDVIKGVVNFVIGSLRIILFLLLLMLVLILLLGTAVMLSKPDTEKFKIPGDKGNFRNGVDALLFLGILLAGCHGTFYNNHKSLRWFSVMVSLYSVYIVADLWTTASKFPTQNKAFYDVMENFQSDYVMDHDFGDNEEAKVATIAWDALQLTQCCGLKNGPSDWDKRFDGVLWPYSCCENMVLGIMRPCRDERRLFKTPCSQRVREIEMFSIAVGFWFVGFLVFLALMSCCIFTFDLEKFYKRKRQQAATGTTVYIGQAPMNEQHFQQPKSIYPSVNLGEKNYSYESSPPPPPTYNVVKN